MAAVPGRRYRRFAAGSAVSAVAIIGAWAALHSSTPTTANLWVDLNGGTCERSASPAAYNDAKACTHDGAFQAAVAGDSVGVKKADYGTIQYRERDTPMTTPGVTFHIAAGTTYDSIDFGCENQSNGCLPVSMQFVDWITMTGTRNTWSARFVYFANATHITVDGIAVDRNWAAGKAVFWAGSTSDTTLKNCRINRNSNSPLMEALFVTEDYTPNANITLQDCDIGLMRRTPEVHNECFLAPATPGLTITRTRWHGCNVMNINIGAYALMGAVNQSGYRFTNNVFESPTNYTENDKTYFPWFQGCNNPDYTQLPDAIWQYNFFESGFYDCGGFHGLTLRGNVGMMGNSGCPAGVTYSHNVFNVACGVTDVAIPDIISNATAYFGGIDTHEWWLKDGSPAIDAGDPGSYPATDITGLTRPVGDAPDAGPNERP